MVRAVANAVKNSRVVSFIERQFLRLEFWGTFVATVGLVIWGYWFGGNSIIGPILEGDRSAIYGTLANVSASLFGFLIAAIAFVIGLSNRSTRLSPLRDSPEYKTLWNVFMSAIWWLGFATLASLMALTIDRGYLPRLEFVYLVTFTTALVAFRLANCVLVLGLIIDVVTAPSKERSGGS